MAYDPSFEQLYSPSAADQYVLPESDQLRKLRSAALAGLSGPGTGYGAAGAGAYKAGLADTAGGLGTSNALRKGAPAIAPRGTSADLAGIQAQGASADAQAMMRHLAMYGGAAQQSYDRNLRLQALKNAMETAAANRNRARQDQLRDYVVGSGKAALSAYAGMPMPSMPSSSPSGGDVSSYGWGGMAPQEF